MTLTKNEPSNPSRGQVWNIRFDPSQGAEIGKIRPAVVMSVPSVGRLPLRIVVPITGWNDRWATVPWFISLKASKRSGLSKDSAADCFQVKSVSLNRFEEKLGVLTADEIEQIAAGIALCVEA